VATLANESALKALFGGNYYPPGTYWFYVALTPVFFLLVYISGVRAASKPVPGVNQWPWWKLVASTIAFAVWALAVPGSPYITPATGALAGLAALFVSSILTLLEPIFTKNP
jgi:hypothetical protein